VRSPFPTISEETAAVVLVVGAPSRLVQVCAEASAMAAAARVKECDVAAAPTMAAKWRPLAIVVPEPAYEIDREELEALARDVRGRLVIVPDDDITTEDLQARLLTAVAEAERLRAD